MYNCTSNTINIHKLLWKKQPYLTIYICCINTLFRCRKIGVGMWHFLFEIFFKFISRCIGHIVLITNLVLCLLFRGCSTQQYNNRMPCKRSYQQHSFITLQLYQLCVRIVYYKKCSVHTKKISFSYSNRQFFYHPADKYKNRRNFTGRLKYMELF